MNHRLLAGAALTWCVIVGGCNAVSGLAGGSDTEEVRVDAPAGILLGDSAHASASARKKGETAFIGPAPATWRSSAPGIVSVNADGLLKALAVGQATISATFKGKTGSAVVTVGSDDARFAYALADQPSAAGPYEPGAANRFSSNGGTIAVTRATSAGVYSVRFAGFGRPPGGKENVQVTAYGGTLPIYCKPGFWNASGADLIVPVSCYLNDGTPSDSKFTILVIGAHAFGASAPLGFLVSLGDTGTVVLDSASTARNTSGGHIFVGHVEEGRYATLFEGLPGGRLAGFMVTAVGEGFRRCSPLAYDITADAGGAVSCVRLGGGPGDNPFSFVWLKQGRTGLRSGYAFADNPNATSAYQTNADLTFNSSSGAVTSKRTNVGTYQVVFSGLARPVGATETVVLSSFGVTPAFCTIGSWSNIAPNDLSVTVTCWNPLGALTNTTFSVLVIQ